LFVDKRINTKEVIFFTKDLIEMLGLVKNPNILRATNSNWIRVQVIKIETLKRKIRKKVKEKKNI